MFLCGGSPAGSMAQSVMGGSDGWASGVCGTVRDGGAVHRALGRAALARRVCLRWVRRAAGVAAEGTAAGLRMRQLSPAGIGDSGNGFSSYTHRLCKWFLAAYLMGRDKRGVSAKFLQRELGVAYQTAWTMAHKLRHGLSEDPARPLHGFLEADEIFIGCRGDPSSRSRSTKSPDKSLVVAAVEKVTAPKNQKGKHGHAVKRQHGFLAGVCPDCRVAGRYRCRAPRLSQGQSSRPVRVC